MTTPSFSPTVADEFAKVVSTDAAVERLGTGFKFVEGPVWMGEGGLIFSDIPASTMRRWTPRGIEEFRKPSHQTNGNTTDLEGRLISCEHESRRVTRTEKDGSIVVLAETFEGRKLNSPNDVVVKSDGTIWFTDPTYGLGKRPKEQAGQYVFRLDPATRRMTAVAQDFVQPNGLCFSPDEKKLYIADSGQPRHIRVFDVKEGGTLAGGGVFCVIDKGVPDGIRCDADGRVWSSAGDGVHIFSPTGELIGKVLLPETCANLCFGGKDGQALYMTASKSLYSLRVKVAGAGRKQ